MEQLTEYAEKFLSGTKPVWGLFIAACNYILFPDQVFYTTAAAVGATQTAMVVAEVELLLFYGRKGECNAYYGRRTD